MNPYLKPEEVLETFRSVYLDENYNFLESDLQKLADAFIMAAMPSIVQTERHMCVQVAKSYNHLVADKLREVRGML